MNEFVINAVFCKTALENEAKELVRIIWIDPNERYVQYVSLTKEVAMPHPIKIIKFKELVENGFMIEARDPFAKIIDEESIPDSHKAIRDKKWQIVSFIWDRNKERVLLKMERPKLFEEAAKLFHVHPMEVRRMMSRFWQRGIIPNALLRVHASHVLMDSWFTHAPLIRAVCKRGLDVIGMVKDNNHRYLVNGHVLSLKELYKAATAKNFKRTGILRSITTILSNDIPVKIVFVRHRTKKREWLAVLSTDVTLDEEEIIRLYGIRWDIETFFKCTKSLLQLGKEFQGRSFDMLISHTTIVFARYIMLSWQHRQQGDTRSLGGLFLAMCDELAELDWVVALNQLLEILNGVAETASKRVAKFIKCQLSQWIAASITSRFICLYPSAKVELINTVRNV